MHARREDSEAANYFLNLLLQYCIEINSVPRYQVSGRVVGEQLGKNEQCHTSSSSHVPLTHDLVRNCLPERQKYASRCRLVESMAITQGRKSACSTN